MELFEASDLKVGLYDKGTTIREIAAEKVKVQTDPVREELDDPFFIFDLGDVIAKDKKWRDLLPSVETFYAVKSNHDPAMVKLLVALGRGFDCASKKEVELVLEHGATPEQIIFAHPYKQESHLRVAKEKGVRLMTFDTEQELYKVKRVHPGAELVLRVFYDSESAMFANGSKFGCLEEDVRPLITLAKKLDLDIVGISFYIGHGLADPDAFEGAIRYVSPMFNFGRSLGLSMNILDLGGGFPGRLRPKTRFEEFAECLKVSLANHFPPSRGVRIIAEPGTFYSRSAGSLLANVMSKRLYKETPGKGGVKNGEGSVTNGDEGGVTKGEGCLKNGEGGVTNSEEVVTKDEGGVKNGERGVKKGEGGVKSGEESPVIMYYLNVGIYNSLMISIFDQAFYDVPEPLKAQRQDVDLKLSCVWGPTCDSNDVIFTRCILPEMDEGDFVIISDTGGYTATCASGFNSYCVPPTCYIAPKETRAILEKAFASC